MSNLEQMSLSPHNLFFYFYFKCAVVLLSCCDDNDKRRVNGNHRWVVDEKLLRKFFFCLKIFQSIVMERSLSMHAASSIFFSIFFFDLINGFSMKTRHHLLWIYDVHKMKCCDAIWNIPTKMHVSSSQVSRKIIKNQFKLF